MASEGLMFWGFRIPPGRKAVKLEIGEDDSDLLECVHVSNVALGPCSKETTKPQRVYIREDSEGSQEIVLGTLAAGSCYQFNVDFVLTKPVLLRTDGETEVHLSGYKSLSMQGGFDDLDLTDEEMTDEDETDEDEEEEEEDEEDKDASNLGNLVNGKVEALPSKSTARKGGKFPVPEHITDDEDEGNLSDELKAIQFDADDTVGEFTDGDDEDEEMDEDEDDEEDEDEEGLSSEDEDEEGSEEEEQVEEKAPEKSAKKRAAVGDGTPAAAKKLKAASGPLTPAPASKPKVTVTAPSSAPAKVAVQHSNGNPPGGNAEEGYLKSLQDFLKKSRDHSAPLSMLGGAVKKPSGLQTKLKAFITQHKETFKVNGDIVSLM